MKVRIGYIGIRGDKLAWSSFASEVFGMQAHLAEELTLRVDEKEWRVRVCDEPGPPLRYLGLELDSFAELDALAGRLQTGGYNATIDTALARQRGASVLLSVQDPDDNHLEFFVGAMTALQPFASPLGVKFITGRSGLGHIGLSVSNLDRSLEFYRDIIGLRRSDILELGVGQEAHFLNGGCRHHVIALVVMPNLIGPHHIFMEVESITEVGLAWDRAQARNIPIVGKIGQHANDPAISFYVESPSGFAFEYGTGSLTIDPENWTETRWQTPHIWGGGRG